MLEAALSWVLIISSPPVGMPRTVIYVESEAVCKKDSDYIIKNIHNATVMCMPIRADIQVK